MHNRRINVLSFLFLFFFLLLFGRLFYWQILSAPRLQQVAKSQHWSSSKVVANRGKILFSDGFPLVENKQAYLVFAEPKKIKEKSAEMASSLAPILQEDEKRLREKLAKDNLNWLLLKHRVDQAVKDQLVVLNYPGIGFEEEARRSYPEGSMAAQLVGFVGFDSAGRDRGYFGLEGRYDLELKGHAGQISLEKDVFNRPIVFGLVKREEQSDGRDLMTSLDRGIQFLVEEKLQQGITKYQAKSGSVVIMQPTTGEILAMSSLPAYDPLAYQNFDPALYLNPVVGVSYEPGSIFKVLVMAAALEEGVVEPESTCDRCAGPRKIADYEIETWNGKYYPGSTMTEVIQHSDNVGMVFAAEKLGKEKLVEYLRRFGLGQTTGIDVQEEVSPVLRPQQEWKAIDLATAAFGQGVAVTQIQMLAAVNVLANQGKLMQPFVVKKVMYETGKVDIRPTVVREVIQPETAAKITAMMVNAVSSGEAKWAKPQGYKIAGKTGTAQIPIAGHYDEKRTVASFVGFAPADKPVFTMLVTLNEPSTSPWGSETAAPLWFEIARELFTYFGVAPDSPS